ncbi:MAG: BtrH N-terminal domain-containing protein [Phycisphaerae bacterium]|nr:BtrH N-terminal domain-containing protein [Phycisphaerae bacterium]
MSQDPGRISQFKTDHCVTGSLRRIYEFHDFPISEDLLLGLGAGVGFVYWHMKGQPPFLGGRANTGRPGVEGLECTAGRRTGVQVELHQTGSSSKAETELLKALTDGPVMVKVDMGFLPYLKIPEGYHFGGHVVVACSYDPSKRQVMVADRDTQLHPVPLEGLRQARGSTFKPFPPKNTWYHFDFRRKHPPSRKEVWQAIQECATGMLEPPISNLGVPGIRKAGTRVAQWATLMQPEPLRYACFNAFVFIDATGGTGGGIFRYMYGRFLEEAAAITGEGRLLEVSHGMRETGDDWQEIAGSFHKAYAAQSSGSHLSRCAAGLVAVAQREQGLWTQLRELSTVHISRSRAG